MKIQKLIVLFLLLGGSAICFVLLLKVCLVPLCEIIHSSLDTVMTSCLIAIPSYAIYLYYGYKNTNQEINSLYFNVYYIMQVKVTDNIRLSTDDINDIIVSLTNISERIGQLRNHSIVNKKYRNDILTSLISDFIVSCRSYNSAPSGEKTACTKQIRICKNKIMGYIEKTEDIAPNTGTVTH